MRLTVKVFAHHNWPQFCQWAPLQTPTEAEDAFLPQTHLLDSANKTDACNLLIFTSQTHYEVFCHHKKSSPCLEKMSEHLCV